MAFLKALAISALVSGASFLAGAVGLSILNIYMAGHGMDWFNQNFEDGPEGVSPMSVVLALIVLTVFITTFTVSFRVTRIQKKKSP